MATTTLKAEDDNKVRPNYALAERFSPNKIRRMVKQTGIQPVWFADGKQFIYAWSDTNGRNFYVVNTEDGTRKKLWDMEWLAQEITMRTQDPYDAEHLPIGINRIIREGRYVYFSIASKLEAPKLLPRHELNDSAKVKANEGKKENKTFHFEYDMNTGELIERTKY